MWDNLGKRIDVKSRRLAIEITPDMQDVIVMFKDKYPNLKFSDSKVIKTFIKAGVMLWVSQNMVDNADEEAVEEVYEDYDEELEDEE
jgi:hypothetical protein